jgi:hypothetical protein
MTPNFSVDMKYVLWLWRCELICAAAIASVLAAALPVMQEVQAEAKRRKVELFIVPTEQAIELLKQKPSRHQCHLARNLLSQKSPN